MKVAWHNQKIFRPFPGSTAPSVSAGAGQMKVVPLSSGLRMVFKHDPNVPQCKMSVLVGVGGVNDPKDLMGVHHFIEHMTFTGTETRDEIEIFQTAASGGISFNAWTSQEFTSYDITGHGKHAKKFLDLLLDMVFHPSFREEKIIDQKGVVCLEIAGSKDDPGVYLTELVTRKMFGSNPYGASVLGTREIVEALLKDDLVNRHQRAYVPGNVVVSVDGNFNPDELVRIAESITIPDRKFEREDVTVKEYHSGVVVEDRDYYDVARMNVFVPGVSVYDRDRFAVDLIRMGVINPIYSELRRLIVEEGGMAYAILGDSDFLRSTGDLSIEGIDVEPESIATVLDIIISEFDRMRDKGLNEDQLAIAKDQCKVRYQLAPDDLLEGLQKAAADVLYHGKPISQSDYDNGIDLVTEADILRVSGRLFNRRYVVGALGPKKKMSKISI